MHPHGTLCAPGAYYQSETRGRGDHEGWLLIDDDAIARCQDGDRDAFRHLVDRYKDVMYGTAVLMTGNRSVAEETVQEAFLSAWRGIAGFKRGRPPKPWLMRILVNRVMDGRRRRSVPTVPLADMDPAGAPSVPDEAGAFENRTVVRQALAHLVPEQQQVVVLRYFAELTVPEVARSIGVKEGTVKSRLHRALGRLREKLEESGVGEVDGHG